MRLGNLAGRAVLVVDGAAVDVAEASGGRFGPDPQELFEAWDDFSGWARGVGALAGARTFDEAELGPPVPEPRQVFAIGINYAAHAAEAGYPPDSAPVTFTKFPSCLAGPRGTVELSSATVDWEVELVVAIAARADRVRRDDAWAYIAGLMVGQDLSDRERQLVGSKPQYSLAKSFRGYGPTGPWLTTPDELADPTDLAIGCTVSGTVMQSGRTSALIYDIPELIARLSAVCTLYAGDLIFTGTPAGVGNARAPKIFLTAADELVSEIEGLGTLITHFTGPTPTAEPGR